MLCEERDAFCESLPSLEASVIALTVVGVAFDDVSAAVSPNNTLNLRS
jgi:hypothetical protein